MSSFKPYPGEVHDSRFMRVGDLFDGIKDLDRDAYVLIVDTNNPDYGNPLADFSVERDANTGKQMLVLDRYEDIGFRNQHGIRQGRR